MRSMHIVIIFILMLPLWTPHAASATTPPHPTSGIEDQYLILVADGTTAQPSDFMSRTLEVTTPASAFDTILFNWTVVGDARDIQLRARFLANTGWSEWRDIIYNPEFVPENAPRNSYTGTPFELNALHQAWQIDVIIRAQSQSYLSVVHAITMNNQTANPQRVRLPSAAVRLPRGSKPPIVSRATWGDATLASWDANAAPWSGYCNTTTNTRTWLPDPSEIAPATHVVIHHTAGGNYDPASHNWAASVLGIWRYHAMRVAYQDPNPHDGIDQNLGWCDIGYHYLIDPNGVIYEGRYTGVRDDGTVIDGAHASGHNRATIGIAFMGTFSNVLPTTAAYTALDNLLSWIGSSKNIPFNTVQHYAHKDKMLNTIVGHRDVGPTECPGSMLYATLPEVRIRAAQNTNKPSDDQWIRGVSADRTSIVAGDVITFRMNVQNIYQTIPISGSAFAFGNADAGFTYDQSQCWALKDGRGEALFPRPDNIATEANNRFRVIAGIRNWDNTYANTVTSCPVASTIDHPWRWSIGTAPLAPGATRTITGRVRFTDPGTYSVYFGVIKDWVGYPDSICNRSQNQGACQLRPIKITVIKPTPTYAPYVRTQIVISTATHARLQTQIAATQTQAAADRIKATRDVARGSPSRTPTPRNPAATPVPAMQSVIALRTATQVQRMSRTATVAAGQTARASILEQTQTARVATQVADDITATAELDTRTPTNTPTVTPTATVTRSATRTATRTRTNQPTQTQTATPRPSRLLDPNAITTATMRMVLSQLYSDGTTVWALKQSNPPLLFAIDPTTLAQRYSVSLDGVSATLMTINHHNGDELFVVGRYAWDMLAVQRFDLSSGTPTRTGIWLYKTMGTPSAVISTGRYVYLAVNHAAQGSTAAYAELVTLANQPVFTEAFIRRRLAGTITALTNIDSGDMHILVAGRINTRGYVIPVRAGQGINQKLQLSTTKPLLSLSARIQTQGLVPAMLIVGSDETRWTRFVYTINTNKLGHINTQINPGLSPELLTSTPFVTVAINSSRVGFDVYTLQQNRYVYQSTINLRSISTAPIKRYAVSHNQMYWHDGIRLYRAVMSLP